MYENEAGENSEQRCNGAMSGGLLMDCLISCLAKLYPDTGIFDC